MQDETKLNLYKSLVLNSGDAMFLFDQKGDIFEVNDSACKSLNYTREELLNLSIPDINPEFQTPEIIKAFKKKLTNDKNLKLFSKHKRKDGSILPVEVSLSLLTENGKQFVLGIARNITIQNKANLSSYIDTLEKIHPILEQSINIEEMLSGVLNLVQDVFETDRSFLISSQELNDQYKIRPFEVVHDPYQKIFTDKNNALSYSQEIHGNLKTNNPTVVIASNFESGKENDTYSEMIVPMMNIGINPYLLGIHQCSYDRNWSELEQKLLLDISRRLSDAIIRLFNNHTLQQSEEKYKTLYDHAPLGYHSLDENGDFVDVNQTWLDLLGYEKEEVIGKNYSDLLHPDYRDNFVNNFPTLKSRGHVQDVHFKLKHKNGNYIHIALEGCIGCHPDGSFKQTYCVIQDISARIIAENELKESEAKFKNFIEQAPVPLSLINSISGEVTFINNRFFDLFGYTHDDVSTIEKWWKLAYPNPKYRNFSIDKWEKTVALATETKTYIVPDVYNITCKDGSIKQILTTGINLGDDFLSMLVDITAQKTIEQELITAKDKAEESEELKIAFLANMSHEIRTPMNGILGFADLLQTPKLSGEKRAKYINIIMKSGDRMLTTINDIIEVSKIETNQIVSNLSETCVNELTAHYHAFFLPEAQKKHIDLYLENGLSTIESEITTDVSMLNSILANLIKNAIKYTDKGSIHFGYKLKNNFLQFYVKDTGIGIPQNKKKIIFDRFRQVKIDSPKAIEGSGLGLSIAKAYVELLGGEIWMESQEGVGSQFYFNIPIRN